jgi:hypothetical protein
MIAIPRFGWFLAGCSLAWLCRGPASVAAQSPPPASSEASWLVADSTTRTVRLALEVTAPPAASSALINGHRSGEVQVVVPLNWTVQWDWHSVDSTAPHSLVVMAEREKLPMMGGHADFTNAMTRMVTAGLRPGQSDQTTFIADQPGWYWLLCGVPGHAIQGEYLELRVDPDARTAIVKSKR